MKHDPSQQYLPPPRFQPRREIVLMWREYYQKTHDGKLPSYGWLAMKSGVYRSTVIRILHAEGYGPERMSSEAAQELYLTETSAEKQAAKKTSGPK